MTSSSTLKRRWTPALVVALAIVIATCYWPREMDSLGGGWYTHYSSALGMDSHGSSTLYRRGPLGSRVHVDDDVLVFGFFPPDCIVYEPHRDVGRVYAACGHRVPVTILDYTVWRIGSAYDADSAGLHHVDSLRVSGGKVVASVSRISVNEIRSRAESRPLLFPGWRFVTGTRASLEPDVRDEPVDPRARMRYGRTPLMFAVANHQRDVVDALIRAGAEVNARDSSRTTPLEMAIRDLETDTAVVRLLLDGGADSNVEGYNGGTPLLDAAGSDDTAVVRMLLAKGADPCHRDKEGRSIVDMSKEHGPTLKAMAQKAYGRCKG